MSEVSTKNIRGRIVGIWQITWAMGALLASLVALSTVNAYNLGDWQWRTVCLVQLVIPSMVAIGIWFVPESPRWLVGHDKVEQGRRALTSIRTAEDDVETEFHEILEAVKWEKENSSKVSILEILRDKSLLRRMLLACFGNLFNQCCGNNALNVFGSQVYTAAFQSASIGLIMTIVQDITQIIGSMGAILWIDRGKSSICARYHKGLLRHVCRC